jgi:hypothetical protein
MCLGCVSDESIYQYLLDQVEFLNATPERKKELQKNNKYPNEPATQNYYGYDSVIFWNIEEFSNWSDMRIRIYANWSFTKRYTIENSSSKLLQSYRNNLDDNKKYIDIVSKMYNQVKKDLDNSKTKLLY